MGFDLMPRNKKVEPFQMGAFSWGWMLDSGVGLVIGYARGREPASFRYQPDKYGLCPMYNDGFHVDAASARAMAVAARTLASSQRAINAEWDALTPRQREIQESSTYKYTYRNAIREDFIEKAERFAEWADKSHGFRVC